jgi:cytoskeletal protein CcmA (bactofilin family)
MAKDISSSSTSLVSRPVVIEGEISGDENLHVDGRVRGIIRLTGDLIVGSGGAVDAEIEARNIVIQGSVTGKIIARRQLEVQATGRFNGECTAASYEIREGAVFEGISRMISNLPQAEKSSVPSIRNPKKQLLSI